MKPLQIPWSLTAMPHGVLDILRGCRSALRWTLDSNIDSGSVQTQFHRQWPPSNVRDASRSAASTPEKEGGGYQRDSKTVVFQRLRFASLYRGGHSINVLSRHLGRASLHKWPVDSTWKGKIMVSLCTRAYRGIGRAVRSWQPLVARGLRRSSHCEMLEARQLLSDTSSGVYYTFPLTY